jgi:pimeloyl-ACP methyl ester carboxylesterase
MPDLHYIEKGKGRPLVLLHAFPVDCRIWNHQIEALSDEYRVIAIDLPGFGKSPPIENFTVDSVALAVHGQLKKMNALPCVLAGLSLGGYVALPFYQQCPTDVQALILIDTRACGDTAEGKKNRNNLIEQADRCGPQAVVDAMMPKVLSDQTVLAQPHVVETVRKMMQDCAVGTMKQALAAMRDRPDRTGLLASIAEPVLIIAGECDGVTPPAEVEKMRQEIPHAQVAIIPDAGHYSPVENPSAVNAALRGFLQGL